MNLKQVGNSWQKLVYNIAGEDYRDFVTLAFGWKKIVGKMLSDKAKLHRLENDVLFIAVTNNVWMQELILRKFQILHDIETILHVKLSEIVFFIEAEGKKGKLKWLK